MAEILQKRRKNPINQSIKLPIAEVRVLKYHEVTELPRGMRPRYPITNRTTRRWRPDQKSVQLLCYSIFPIIYR
jgi:hypothetical protein